MRHFGLISGRSSLTGGTSTRPSATRDAILPRDSILFPSDDVPPLESRDIAQALLNGLAVVGVFLLVSSAAVAVTAGIFILLVVDTTQF